MSQAEGPNIETGPSVNKINYADVWNHEDMKNDYETLDNLEINITNNDTTMTCKAKFNLYHPKTWKGKLSSPGKNLNIYLFRQWRC